MFGKFDTILINQLRYDTIQLISVKLSINVFKLS